MSKPLLLLDVDGVLCPFGFRWNSTESGIVISETGVDDIPEGYEFQPAHDVYVSKDNTRRLEELMLDFDLVWCTGWCEAANEIIGPLHGLPELPVVNVLTLDLNEDHDHIHWKGSAIKEHVGDKPFAFVDDDIQTSGMTWAEARNEKVPTLWIKTDHRIGLTDEHVEQLRQWAKEIECK